MSMYDERARGVTLRKLDLSVLQRQGEEDFPGQEVSIGFAPYGVHEAPDGTLHVICNEGVGWEVTDGRPLQLDLYVSSPGHIAILPSARANLTPEEVRRFTTDEEVDLADLVRTFGARLESNFWVWHHKLADPREEVGA